MASLINFLKYPLRTFNKSGVVIEKHIRRFSVNSSQLAAYEADGKTTVNILNSEEGASMMINSYSLLGFRLNNGIFVVGPVAMFPRTVLSWNVKDDYDVNEKSLSLFLHLAPKLDVLVIGLSDARNQQLLMNVRKEVYEMMNRWKPEDRMNIEVLPTEKAVTTFNFLNAEKRFVGAALIPPTHYSATLDDEFRTAYLTKKRESKENDILLGG
ncbi:NADH dehydrogenase [ubiquinone] 1 alpha subcomplex assembly factor 3 [Homalodisca vitripennis]|nr:NADH dehydrogenase [ubiquinone] 1 alpha subcomplex assembly factor 3 [Homalodisca vitripennis]KAG8318676.1 NADH dehydrogenase [ubiquinone] 1 alpha subcomplex assembly factor 3 [Homalodisca vitripennis]